MCYSNHQVCKYLLQQPRGTNTVLMTNFLFLCLPTYLLSGLWFIVYVPHWRVSFLGATDFLLFPVESSIPKSVLGIGPSQNVLSELMNIY